MKKRCTEGVNDGKSKGKKKRRKDERGEGWAGFFSILNIVPILVPDQSAKISTVLKLIRLRYFKSEFKSNQKV